MGVLPLCRRLKNTFCSYQNAGRSSAEWNEEEIGKYTIALVSRSRAERNGTLTFSACLSLAQESASHKVIEKRRRDRINKCLGELSKLIPAAYVKQVNAGGG